MSLEILSPSTTPDSSGCTRAYASHQRLTYADAHAAAAPPPSPRRGRPRFERCAKALPTAPWSLLGRLGLRHRISVHGRVVDCRGVLTFVPDEPFSLWRVYDVLLALAFAAGAILALAT